MVVISDGWHAEPFVSLDIVLIVNCHSRCTEINSELYNSDAIAWTTKYPDKVNLVQEWGQRNLNVLLKETNLLAAGKVFYFGVLIDPINKKSNACPFQEHNNGLQ